jgi:hypothetical protein
MPYTLVERNQHFFLEDGDNSFLLSNRVYSIASQKTVIFTSPLKHVV